MVRKDKLGDFPIGIYVFISISTGDTVLISCKIRNTMRTVDRENFMHTAAVEETGSHPKPLVSSLEMLRHTRRIV